MLVINLIKIQNWDVFPIRPTAFCYHVLLQWVLNMSGLSVNFQQQGDSETLHEKKHNVGKVVVIHTGINQYSGYY